MSEIRAPAKITSLAFMRQRAPRVEDMQTIFDRLFEGEELQKVCEDLQVHYPTVITRISSDPHYRAQLAVSDSIKASKLATQAIEAAQDLLSEEPKHKASDVKAASAILTWAAGQLDPEKWGKSRVEVTGKDGKDLNQTNVVVFELPKNGR